MRRGRELSCGEVGGRVVVGLVEGIGGEGCGLSMEWFWRGDEELCMLEEVERVCS